MAGLRVHEAGARTHGDSHLAGVGPGQVLQVNDQQEQAKAQRVVHRDRAVHLRAQPSPRSAPWPCLPYPNLPHPTQQAQRAVHRDRVKHLRRAAQPSPGSPALLTLP